MAGSRRVRFYSLSILMPFAAGCGALDPPDPLFVFSMPLTVNGESVGDAFIDTGGGYEILLGRPNGLDILGEIEVLAFGGKESLEVTGPFTFAIGGFHGIAGGALVGLSICDCNGLGYQFFRHTGLVLALDFPRNRAEFLLQLPDGEAVIVFSPPPLSLSDFESAFVEVDVHAGGTTKRLLGLLDTGANLTVMQKGLFANPSLLSPDFQTILVTHEKLGTVQVTAGLFETDGLPDIILGVDVMRAWADEWYFDFTSGAGSLTVVFESDDPAEGQPARARPR
jgi:hypothetical protein